MLDLLPLSQCFQARGRSPPQEIAGFVKKALAFLRFMRMGDGMLARFNGVSAGSPAALAADSGYCDGELEAVAAASRRVMPVWSAGQRSLSPMSARRRLWKSRPGTGRRSVIRNVVQCLSAVCQWRLSRPCRPRLGWRGAGCRQPQYAVPCGSSSSRLVRHESSRPSSAVCRSVDDLVASKLSDENGVAVRASHDGYLKRYGSCTRGVCCCRPMA